MQNDYSKQGEEQAGIYLQHKGYKILDKNYRALRGEIDLICSFKSILVFVEVKRRSSAQLGDGLEAITFHKIKQIVKTALFYIKERKFYDLDYRFDVISIQDDEQKIQHIENAFSADGVCF